MSMKQDLLSFNNPVLHLYASSACILILKMLCLGVIIPIIRIIKKVPGSPEDAEFLRATMKNIESRKGYLDRVKRSHNNDLENIPFFLFIGLIYVLADPPMDLSKILFRVYTAARVIHTCAYISKVRQPVRALSFVSGLIAVLVMIIFTFYHNFQ